MSSTSSLLTTPPSPPPLTDQPEQHHPFSLLSNPNFFSNKSHEEQKQKSSFENPQFGFSLSPCDLPPHNPNLNPNYSFNKMIKRETNDFHHMSSPMSSFYQETTPPAYSNFMMTSPFRSLPQGLAPLPASSSAHLSATALLQKAATMGPQQTTMSRNVGHMTSQMSPDYAADYSTWQHKSEHGMTRDFLGLTASGTSRNVDVNVNVNVNGRNLVSFTRGIELPPYEHGHSRMRSTHLGFAERQPGSGTWGNC